MLVHINSWPGAGKKTIGERLARRRGAQFLHNHLILDLVDACCDRGQSSWQQCYDHIRKATYDALAQHPKGVDLIMTNAIAEGESELWAQIVQLAERRGDMFVPIVLEISAEENRRRLCDPARSGSKLRRVEVLNALRAEHRLLVPDLPQTLVLEVSGLTAEEAEGRIDLHLSELAMAGSRSG